jgi:cystathionine gamma-synthase
MQLLLSKVKVINRFSSGVAAETTLFELFRPGDHIMAGSDLYGGPRRLFAHISRQNGLLVSFVHDCLEIAGPATPRTKTIFLEAPTNPMVNVMDISVAAAVAQERTLLLIIDNTFQSAYFQRPAELGAGLVSIVRRSIWEDTTTH